MKKQDKEYVPSAKDVYRSSTTHFRRRRIKKKTVFAIFLIVAVVSIIAASVWLIIRGGDYKGDRREKIIEGVNNPDTQIETESEKQNNFYTE